jgi:hypothetical protein
MGPRCDITFDNNRDGIYFAGQTMSGVAIMDLVDEIKVRKVELKIEGYAECEWRESRQVKTSNGTRTEYTTFRGHEQYLNSVTLLVPSETHIQPGRHTYNFMLQIPPTTPSSMNAQYGHVIYRVVLNLDRPWKFDVTFKQEFTVICPVNINVEPSWMMPCSDEEIKYFCCLCCESEPVIVTVKIQKGAFIPGDRIHVSTRINNPTDTAIDHLEYRIVKTLIYESQTPRTKTKHEEVKIYSEDAGDSVVSCTKDFNHSILVPPTPASTVNPNFRVIRISYVLSVKAKVFDCHASPKIHIPIIIGTVPMPEPVQPIQPVAPQVSVPIPDPMLVPMIQPSAPFIGQPSAPVIGQPSAPMIPPHKIDPAIADPDAPPPTFEEAMNLPQVDQEAIQNYNTSRPLGFVIPGSTEKS